MPENETPEEARHVKPFADWLQEQRNGLAASELADALNAVVEAVADHGKVGKLTLTVSVKPATKAAQGMVIISDAIKVALPEPDRAESLFFVDVNNNLSRNDPRQQKLPLRDVSQPPHDADDDEDREVAP